MATIANQGTTRDHTNADSLEKTSIARMAGQCHENENSPIPTPIQSRKYIPTIPTNDGEHRNNRTIYSAPMEDANSGNQDTYHKRQGQKPTLRDAETGEIDGRN